MTLVIQGQGHSGHRRVILSTFLIVNTLFIMMLLGTKFIYSPSNETHQCLQLQWQGLSSKGQRDFHINLMYMWQ